MQLVRKQEHLSITFLIVLHKIPAHQPAANERVGMQVSEITFLGVGMLKSFTEHNQLRTGIISKSYPNYSSTNYPSAMQSYNFVVNQDYFEIITDTNGNSIFFRSTHLSILQHNPVGEGHWIADDDDCLCLFRFSLRLHVMY